MSDYNTKLMAKLREIEKELSRAQGKLTFKAINVDGKPVLETDFLVSLLGKLYIDSTRNSAVLSMLVESVGVLADTLSSMDESVSDKLDTKFSELLEQYKALPTPQKTSKLVIPKAGQYR